MLGATETSNGPEVAPAGIAMMIEVLLQELIVTGVLFRVTKLPLSATPNPDPVIATWLPIDPVVAETLVMTGAGAAAELTDTLSKVVATRDEVLLLLTARPM